MRMQLKELQEKIEAEGHESFFFSSWNKGKFVYTNDYYRVEFTTEYRDDLYPHEYFFNLMEMDITCMYDYTANEEIIIDK